MKYYKYLSYVLRHKYFVMRECFKMGLIWRGLIHDLSKLYPDEFFAYVEYFYGGGTTTDALVISFDLAWLHHQKRNKHHWQWWVLREDDGGTKVLEMPSEYLVEMVCDWVGAGRAMGYISPLEDPYLETRKWYGTNKSKMQLHDSSRRIVEDLIGYKGT
jgi:hypothetical protein